MDEAILIVLTASERLLVVLFLVMGICRNAYVVLMG